MPGKKLWGIDLGGTKIECAVLDPKLDTLIRKRLPTESDLGYEHLIKRVKTLVDEVSAQLGEVPEEIGFATPGMLEPGAELMKNCNTVSMNGRPMKKDLQQALGIPVKIANDANCFALAETLMGTGKQYPNAEVIFGIIMGTGVGGGIIVHNRIIEGKQGLTGEWGHNVLEPGGEICYCGKKGCVEKVISGPALEAFYAGISNKSLKLDEIYRKYREAPDKHVNATIDRLLEGFGKALAVVINILDPDLVIVGGGVGNIDLLYTEGYEQVRKHVFNNGKLTTPVCKPTLGDSAGVFGAALLWSDPKKYFTQCL